MPLITTSRRDRTLTALVLTSLLYLGAGLVLVELATACSGNPSDPQGTPTAFVNLPQAVRDAVLQEASTRSQSPVSALTVESAERQTWSDGCLGLSEPDILCSQALVPGWRVVVASDRQRLVYRTDESGSVVKLDLAASNMDKARIHTALHVVRPVLEQASQSLALPPSSLGIESAKPQTWSDGCLGLSEPGIFCTQALVPGLQVVVTSDRQRLVYRTDESGSVVKLDRAASNVGEVKEDILFRATTSGGIAGRTYETTLFPDGRVVRVLVSPNQNSTSEPQIHRISPQQLEKFQTLLERFPLSQFDGQIYPPPRGAADYIKVTLTSDSGTVRYVDFAQNTLPQPLQEIVKAWNEISTPPQ